MTVAVSEGSEVVSYISYSALTDYIKCSKYWQLKRQHKLPETPAWYFAGGSAVHAATEAFDRMLFAEQKR